MDKKETQNNNRIFFPPRDRVKKVKQDTMTQKYFRYLKELNKNSK